MSLSNDAPSESSTPAAQAPPTYPVEGGCFCGAVRYRLKGPPSGQWVCWCLDCKKVTGTFCSANSYHKANVSLRIARLLLVVC